MAGASVERAPEEDVQCGEETHRDAAMLGHLALVTGGSLVSITGSFYRSVNLTDPNGSLSASGVAAGMAGDAEAALNTADAPGGLAVLNSNFSDSQLELFLSLTLTLTLSQSAYARH